jgi:hypothetical protein
MEKELGHEIDLRFNEKERIRSLEMVSSVRAVRPYATAFPTVWGTVIRGLLYPDAAREPEDGPVVGYGEYIIRLRSTTITYPSWEAGVWPAGSYAVKDFCIYYTAQETEAVPPASPWVLNPEINPRHQTFGVVSDWRHFVPWFRAGDPVELYKSGGHYYFAQQMIRTRDSAGGMQTVMWNPEEKRMMAVYG